MINPNVCASIQHHLRQCRYVTELLDLVAEARCVLKSVFLNRQQLLGIKTCKG
jgi:hypothetical protein